MDRAKCGLEMSTRWSDPPMVLMYVTLFTIPATLIFSIYASVTMHIGAGPGIWAACWILYRFVYLNTEKGCPEKYLKFKNDSFKARWSNKKIPISTFLEAYRAEYFDLNGDMLEILGKRNEFLCYRVTASTIFHLYQQLMPFTEITGLASGAYDHATAKREIADHYDRGNDWFGAFLGPRMVYTSAVWKSLEDESLEQAQDNKMELICQKLDLQKDHKYLDIGCGWGTLVRHATRHHGAQATGVTLSAEGAIWCNAQNEKEGVETNILEMDYRHIPANLKFDRISAIEMAEHVGLSNFQDFLAQISAHLEDDGRFLMQVAGLRQGSNWEDTAWALFMSRYIFPNADASTPLNWYVRQLERAGFEVHSVETIGRQYSHTLHAWYDNFMVKKSDLDIKKYPESLQRLWIFFLAWSVIASGQGSAACYQILAHKNRYEFPRDDFIGENTHENLGTVSNDL